MSELRQRSSNIYFISSEYIHSYDGFDFGFVLVNFPIFHSEFLSISTTTEKDKIKELIMLLTFSLFFLAAGPVFACPTAWIPVKTPIITVPTATLSSEVMQVKCDMRNMDFF